MSETERRLEALGRAIMRLPEPRRRIFLAWAAARAGVRLWEAPDLAAIARRLAECDPARAAEVLDGLEEGLAAVLESDRGDPAHERPGRGLLGRDDGTPAAAGG